MVRVCLHLGNFWANGIFAYIIIIIYRDGFFEAKNNLFSPCLGDCLALTIYLHAGIEHLRHIIALCIAIL